MIIASWNINSVRVRTEQLLNWLGDEGGNNIDVIMLQETKCLNEAFPIEAYEDAGYNVSLYGQKTYNGVAIISKYRIEEVVLGNEIFIGDTQARYIEALINGVTVASVYVPNGVAPFTETYSYKLNFLKCLREHLQGRTKFVIGGDFNIALTDNDVYNPKQWKDKICCTDTERELLFSIIDSCKLTDCLLHSGYRDNGNNEKIYTWWDYRTGAFAKNNGLRLDYIFTSNDIEIKDAYVAKDIRALERPSDHAPVVVRI